MNLKWGSEMRDFSVEWPLMAMERGMMNHRIWSTLLFFHPSLWGVKPTANVDVSQENLVVPLFLHWQQMWHE